MGSGSNATLELLQGLCPEGTPTWVLWSAAAGLGTGLVLGLISFVAMFSVWLERKVSGHIQCRYGPMYVGGWHGWAQPIADGVKLLLKEDLIPKGADAVLFVFAPALVLASIVGAMAAYHRGDDAGAWEMVNDFRALGLEFDPAFIQRLSARTPEPESR